MRKTAEWMAGHQFYRSKNPENIHIRPNRTSLQERFTDAAISALAARRSGLVFLLWGNAAREKAALVSGSGKDNGHLVLQTVRPPYARMRSPCPITL